MIKDKSEALKCIKLGLALNKSQAMEELSDELKNDDDIIFELIKNNQSFVNDFSNKLIEKPELMERIFNEISSELYHRLSPEVKNNEKFMLQLLQYDSNAAYNLGTELRRNLEFMEKAVKINNETMYFASPEIKPRLEKAVKKETEIENKLKDKTEVLERIKLGFALNKEQVMRELSEELKNDNDIIFELIKNNQSFVNDFSNKLVEAPELMDKVFNEINSDIYHRLSPEVKNNTKFMLQLLKHDSNAAYNLGSELKENLEFMEDAAKINNETIHFASAKIKPSLEKKGTEESSNITTQKKEVSKLSDTIKALETELEILEAENDSTTLEERENIKNEIANTKQKIEQSKIIKDKNVALERIKLGFALNKEQVMRELSDELKNDNDIIFELIKNNQSFVNNFSNKLIEKPELMEKVFSEISSDIYHRLSPELKNNEKFMLQLLQYDSNAAYNLGPELKKNLEFMKNAVNINNETMYFASAEIKPNLEKMVEEATAQKNQISKLSNTIEALEAQLEILEAENDFTTLEERESVRSEIERTKEKIVQIKENTIEKPNIKEIGMDNYKEAYENTTSEERETEAAKITRLNKEISREAENERN